MLENLTFTAHELLIAVVLATGVYLVEVLIFSRRRSPVRDQSMVERLDRLEAELKAMKARLELLEDRPPMESALDTQSSTYAEAVRMAREDLPPQELVERLGISVSEAELIVALHKAGS